MIEQNHLSHSPSTPAPALKGIQVLLVEDEYDIADLFTFVLKEYGAEVIYADSAAEALLALDQQQPHILICNIKLPDHDGTWLIRQIREQGVLNQAVPAIAVTSYTREVSIERVFEAGFQHFLAKPIDPDELLTSILRLMQQPDR